MTPPPGATAFTAASGNRLGTVQPQERFDWDVRWGSLSARFEWIASQSPGATALIDRSRRWTYSDLNRQANQLAHRIIDAAGAAPAPVALLFELDAELVPAIYAVLKARKFYVPLDPHLPVQRLSRLIADTGALLIVSSGPCAGLARELAAAGRRLLLFEEASHGRDDNPALPAEADDLAYVMYTSGSTGEPKGVMHTHRNVLFDMWRQGHDLRTVDGDVYGLLFAASSSASCCSVFGALLNGAAVSCFDLRRHSLADFADWLERDHVTICDVNVAALRMCAASLGDSRRFPSMRLIAPGGEPVYRTDVELCRRLFPHAVVQNSLGTTETRTATQCFIEPDAELADAMVPIGYPVEGKQVLLLDENGHDAMEGEIAVRSRYLSPGYWKQPALTARAFLPAADGETTYLTGDIGRRLPDGRMIHLGRRDHQVKVRGYRVEVGEVENLLLGLPGIDDAAVVPQPDSAGRVRLVAYIAGNGPFELNALRRACATALPAYCVPAEFRRVAQLPKTANGKLDRRSVGALGGARLVEDRPPGIAARTKQERALVRIFADVLGCSAVGIHDDFFERGGDSLRAVDCIARIETQFRIRLPLARFLEHPTVAAVSALVAADAAQRSGLTCLRRGPDDRRLYLIHGYFGTVIHLQRLAEAIDPSFSVYGVESVQTATRRDMAALGDAYARALEAFQPNGTFRIAGYSFGGTLAYEVARQLSARGRDVTFVGIIDSTPNDRIAGVWANPLLFVRNVIPCLVDEARLRGLGPFTRRLTHGARRVTGRIFGRRRRYGSGRRVEETYEYQTTPEYVRDTVGDYLAASLGYRPPPADLNVVLFAARIRPLSHSLNPARAWRHVVPRLRVHTLDGNHVTLIDPARSELPAVFNDALNST